MRAVAVAICLLLGCFGSLPAWAQPRVALVIGNSTYQNVALLPNPVNDATDVSASLTRLGFDVRTLKNAGYDDMRRALLDFGRRARGAELAVVYFAGHGIQMGGDNWLIPVDAVLATDQDIRNEAIGLETVSATVSTAKKLGLVILDACRTNPFIPRMQTTNVRRAVERGFSRIEPPSNTLIAYAAREGTTAQDGTGRNSPFTKSLLENLETPGLEIGILFRRVRDDVLTVTRQEQEPVWYASLSRDPIFLSTGAVSHTADDILTALPDFEATSRIDTVAGWDAFLKQHPDGALATAARERRAKAGKPGAVANITSDQKPHPLIDAAAAGPGGAQPADGLRRAWLGVRIQPVTDEIAQSLDVRPRRGGLVAKVEDKGPAGSAGVELGDVVVKFDGRDVAEPTDLARMVGDASAGKEVNIVVIRKGREQALSLTLGRIEDAPEKPAAVVPQSSTETPAVKAIGLDLATSNADLRNRYKIKDSVKGVVVTGVDAGSDASDKKLSAGEVIVEVAQKKMSNATDVSATVDQLRKDGKTSALLLVSSADGELRFVAIDIAARAQVAVGEKPATQKLLGLELASLTKDTRVQYKIKESVKGLVVAGVDGGSDAAEKRLSVGDVIVEAAQVGVASVPDLMKRIDLLRKKGKKSVLLLISNGDGELRFVALSL